MYIFLIILFIINIVSYSFCVLPQNLKILQLEEYSILKLFKYNIKNKYIYFYLYLIDVLIFILFTLFNYNIFVFMILIFGTIRNFLFYKKDFKLKITNRVKRIISTFFILTLSVIILSLIFKIMTYISILSTIILDFLTIISNFIIIIFEIFLHDIYLNKANKKLKQSNLVKIAIVGSYGKTSVKNILATILKEKYVVLSTPESYNTPNGLAITINNNDLQKYQIIIMEMGAKKSGDISNLCKYFTPNYAILTSIGQQHLQTFKSIDEIIKTKSEVINYSEKTIFNCDNNYLNDVYKSCIKPKFGVGENQDLRAVIKEVNLKNSIFDMYYKNDFFGEARTNLVGKHNINNILLAVAMAIELGLGKDQILKGISNLQPIKSRMEKIVLHNGATIINNGYNSNPDSARASLDLMKLYKDKKKIIITPGFVEMGKFQYDLNFEFGKEISEVADQCIIVNKVNSKAITEAFKEKSYSKYNIVSKFKDIDFSKFDENDVVLIENDLPENYV